MDLAVVVLRQMTLIFVSRHVDRINAMDNSNSNLKAIESNFDSRSRQLEFPKTDTAASTAVTPQEKEILASRPGQLKEGNPAGNGRKVTCEHLINRLNFINFQEQCIQVYFTHLQYDRSLVISGTPEPCLGEILTVRWADSRDMQTLLKSHVLDFILVPRGQRFVKAVPRVIDIDAYGARLQLPELSCEVNQRKTQRQSTCGISVLVIQNSSSFSGHLRDFAACAFRAKLVSRPPQTFEWIDPDLSVHVILFAGNQTYYTGECRIVRQTEGSSSRCLVLEPLKDEIRRYRKAEYRSQRQRLNPSPNIIFRHPLTQKRVELKVVDLSGTGFSVEEDEQAAVLLPGLVLPDVELRFANGFSISCSAQVVFRRTPPADEKNRRIRCGMAMIDVTAQDHIKLLGMLHQVQDKNSYICNDLDLEALWDFLFETGFIYPSKYALIEKNKKAIKETYAKLYTRSPDIARHFVYQDNGVILGHMAMIRFWENSWLIHHHAARKSALNRAGLVVLDQIGRFGHDSFRIRGMHMDYLVCYYRPQNRFPKRVFGGVCRYIDDPKGCSLDPFAFLKAAGTGGSPTALPAGWQLETASTEDLKDLSFFYERISGGLLLKAMDLDPANAQEQGLSHEFRKHGFKRERHLLALRKDGCPKALMTVNVSDIGLNLSDLTHCISAVVLDPENLSPEVFDAARRLAEKAAAQPPIPALVFPLSYVVQNAIPYEKVYNLWVFHMHSQSQNYFRYLSRLMKYV